MAETRPEFYATLPSNSSMVVHPTNKPQAFTVDLSQPITLEGNWEVALMELQYPNNWFNITKVYQWRINLQYKHRASGILTDEEYANGCTGEGTFDNNNDFTFHFGPGCYPSVANLCSNISEELHAQVRINFHDLWRVKNPIDLIYNEKTRKVETKCSKFFSAVALFSHGADTELERMLGLLYIRSGRMRMQIGRTATNEANFLSIYPALFVYCDLVENQIVGDTKAPLLRTVPVAERTEDIGTHIFVKPYYIPVKKNYISSVDIAIHNDTGELVKFQTGKTILVLHFRKCGLSI